MAVKKVTKNDIVEAIAASADIDQKDIKRVIDSFLEQVKKSLTENAVIELRGFGTFEVRVRKGRQKARNPRTGDIVSVKSHGVALFRAGQELKKAVWEITAMEADGTANDA
ncbi:MAG: integration host factor subunit beta [Spirochaetaceae bacterium]|jgi:integration host factor subunit beta|nr:integration host factor subunit beta [Spirochaetaceae bacterium]